MTSDDRAKGAAALKALRRSRGMSLSDCSRALREQAAALGHLAGAVPTIAGLQRSVSRWESATSPTLPDERHRLLLCCLYARTTVGDIVLGPGSDFAEVLNALEHMGVSRAEVEALRSTVARTLTDKGVGLITLAAPEMSSMLTTVLAHPERADEGLAAGLQAAVAEIEGRLDSLPFLRLQLMLAPVVEAGRRLLAMPVPEPVLPSLRSAVTSAYVLAGRLAFELHDDVASQALYSAAAREAELLEEPWRRAAVHLDHALVALHGAHGLDRTRRLADAAVRDANKGPYTAVRPFSHAWQAVVAARSGERRLAQHALALAAYGMDRAPFDDPSGHTFSPWHLHCSEGVCALFIGDVNAAHDLLGRTLQASPSDLPLAHRAIIVADLALARVDTGDPRAAAELLHECIDLSYMGGRIPAVRLRWARKALAPWRSERFVVDLDDHLLDAALGSEQPPQG